MMKRINKNNIGIYRIINKVNGKFYIGSTSTIGFVKRWNKHILDLHNQKHHSIYLQRAWNKYGEKNFKFEILEICNKNDCLSKEQYYLDKFNPNYNICKIAGSTLGYKFPKSYCLRIKKLRKGKNNPFYGKTHSEENKIKFSQIIKGKWNGNKNPKYKKGYLIEGKNNPFYGKKHSKETKSKISKINKGKRMSNEHPNFAGLYKFYHKVYGKIICGQCDLIRKYDLDNSHVNSICNGKRNNHRGWICLGKI